MTEIQIHQISFGDNTVEIGYTVFPEEMRVGGKVTMFRTVGINILHPDYGEDADLLMRQAQRMLRNVLEDYDESEPFDPSDQEDEEDRGMGE